MALKAWYTFNNNYDNQGCGDANLTVTTAPTYVDGKIGKALNQGGFKWTATQTAQILNNKALSICFWVYINLDAGSTSNRAMFFGNDSQNSAGGRQFSLFNYPTSNDFHWSWQNYINGAYTSITSGILTGVIPARTWTHVAVTYENPNGTIYINGVQKQTFTGTYNADSFAFDTRVIQDNAYHRFNDYRVYDECLSPKQVKEISKGLVAHYKLTGVEANPNLLIGAKMNQDCNNKNWTRYGLNNVTSSVYTGEAKHIITPLTGQSRNNGEGFSWTDITSESCPLEIGNTYTFSMDIKGTIDSTSTGGYLGYMYNSNPDSATYQKIFAVTDFISTLKKDTYTRYSMTFTVPSEAQYKFSLQILIGYGGDIYYKNVKLEKGDKKTFWVPNINDIEYTKFNYENDICTDVSGNGYNAIKSGTFTLNTDSPRYNNSVIFNNGYLHKISSPLNINSDAFTISCWLYPTQNATMCLINDRKAVGDGLAVFYLGGGVRFDTGANYQWQVGSIAVNAWNHIVVTWDKTAGNKKLYLNGNLINTTTNYGTLAQIGDVFSIGNSSTNGAAGAGNQIYGSISDFRIYATALSADDILTMYKNSSIIDNKGNVYAYEFKEE